MKWKKDKKEKSKSKNSPNQVGFQDEEETDEDIFFDQSDALGNFPRLPGLPSFNQSLFVQNNNTYQRQQTQFTTR